MASTHLVRSELQNKDDIIVDDITDYIIVNDIINTSHQLTQC